MVTGYGRGMPVISLPDREWIELVGPVAGCEMVIWDLVGEPPRPDEISFVVPPYMTSSPWHRLAQLPGLRVVQLLSAGYDTVLPAIPAGVKLANAAGVHDASTAELAVTLTLSSLRGIPEFVGAQGRSQWLPAKIRDSLADKKVLILGYGGIGVAIARRLSGFEVKLTAVASRARGGDELVACVHGVDELPVLLPEHDVVIVIVPLSGATTGLVGREFLASMRDGALLVNVSRGRVVDTQALVEATGSGRIRAALDVTDPEPLPPEHPLWQTPGVLISPHVGGVSTAFTPRAVALLRDQISAFVAERGLRNVVNAAEAEPSRR
jgi:phosphoglycerate dehydrogenase-like enzyme